MNFTLSEDQQALQSSVRKFATTELVEVAREIEETDVPVKKDLLKRYSEMGLLGINLPIKYGGLGLTHLDAVIALEEVAKISVAVAFPIFESSFGPALAVAEYGSESLKQRILPDICRGESLLAVSMSEPNAGSALTDLKTAGSFINDKIILSGSKRWCSGATHADKYLVYCRLSDEPGVKGIGAVIVDKGMRGFTFGRREKHMGFK